MNPKLPTLFNNKIYSNLVTAKSNPTAEEKSPYLSSSEDEELYSKHVKRYGSKRKITKPSPNKNVTIKHKPLLGSHIKEPKKYNFVQLSWDENNKPTIEHYDHEKINLLETKDCYIFKHHSGIVKIADDQYLDTATGKISITPSNSTQVIEWQGKYTQLNAKARAIIIEGDRTIHSSFVNNDKKTIFDSSDSEDYNDNYAGLSSEDDAFVTAESDSEWV